MEDLQRDFKGIWIPKEVWLDSRLTALDKIILMEIHSLDSEEKGCYASNKYLADFCQCTETKVSTTISKLKEFGYIELTNFDGRYRSLKIKSLSLKNLKSDIKNFKSNNIDNNILNNNINNINIIDIEKTESTKSSILEKPKKELTEKQKQAIERNKILEEFIKDEDEDIQKAFKDYVNIRRKRGLEPKQLQIILEDFEKAYKNKSKQEILEQLRKATAGGWMQLVYTFNGKPKTTYGSKPTFDNTAGNDVGNRKITDEEMDKWTFEEKRNYIMEMQYADMTPKQKDFFNKYCLARDENGNILKF